MLSEKSEDLRSMRLEKMEAIAASSPPPAASSIAAAAAATVIPSRVP